MNLWTKVFGITAVGIMALACGKEPSEPEGELAVQGSVSSAVQIDNARAVAIGSDGRQFWAYIDRDRDFTLRLPVGQSYRIIIANQLEGGGQVKVGHLVLRGIDGKTEWLGANEPGTVDLGRLRPVKSGDVQTQCSECKGGGDDDDEDEEDDKDDHADDKECHEKGKKSSSGDDDHDDDEDEGDDDDECNVCKDDEVEDKELEPSKNPGKKCEDKEKNEGKVGKKSCGGDCDGKGKSKGSDDESGSGSGGGKSKQADDEKPCPKKKDRSGSSGGSGSGDGGGSSEAPAPSDDAEEPGSKPEGSSCKVTKECEKVCACVASKCEKK